MGYIDLETYVIVSDILWFIMQGPWRPGYGATCGQRFRLRKVRLGFKNQTYYELVKLLVLKQGPKMTAIC